MKKKTTALILACILILGVVIGGTVAWIVDVTGEVQNVFVIGDINIELWEHQANADGTLSETVVKEGETNTYAFVPGDVLKKDPTVTVKAGSEACYLFVKVTEENNTFDTDKKVLTYAIDAGWTEYADGVYYKVIGAATAEDTPHNILAETQVTVNGDITKADVTTMTAAKPALKFKAAAVQKDNIATVQDAFAKIEW